MHNVSTGSSILDLVSYTSEYEFTNTLGQQSEDQPRKTVRSATYNYHLLSGLLPIGAFLAWLEQLVLEDRAETESERPALESS